MSARQVWFWDFSGQRESPGLITPALYLLCGKKRWLWHHSLGHALPRRKKDHGCTESPAILEKMKEFCFVAHTYLQFPAAHGQWLPTQQWEVWLSLGARALTPGNQGAQHLPCSYVHQVLHPEYDTSKWSNHFITQNLFLNYRGICTSSTNRVIIRNICCFSCSF